MGRMRDVDTSTNSFDYCRRCWTEFTMLTEQEFNVWKSLLLKKHGVIAKEEMPIIAKREHKTHKKVICINTGKVYFNCAEASRDTGVNKMTIYQMCSRGEYKEVKARVTDLKFRFYREGEDD